MSFEHNPGTTVIVMNQDFKPAGEAIVDKYSISDRAYYVWYLYQNAGEKEYIKIPEWRLLKRPQKQPGYK